MTSPTNAYPVDQFMADARATYTSLGSTDAGRQELGALLQRLARTPGIIAEEELAALHGGEATATVLASEGPEGLTLMLACFTTPTSVHDHGSWGVACVVQGQDRYQEWERMDNGDEPTHAEVRMRSEQELSPGDVVTWSGPPHDLHAQQGIDGAAWELVLFGRNVTQLPRHYFDPESGAVRTALPQ
jgi:predicted metal-dependent enzyme (double-stranded beta helix superfamily)